MIIVLRRGRREKKTLTLTRKKRRMSSNSAVQQVRFPFNNTIVERKTVNDNGRYEFFVIK